MPAVLDPFVSGGIGLVGTLVGAGIAYLVGERNAKWDNTVSLLTEFDSPPMLLSRDNALQFVYANPATSLSRITYDLNFRSSVAPLWDVIYFYKKLSFMLDNKRLVDHAISEMFGQTFVWWYVNCFRDQLVHENWDAAVAVRDLYRDLERLTSRPRKVFSGSRLWASWHEQARRDFIERRPPPLRDAQGVS